MRVLAVIPARAGSRGIPGKNKAPVAGRPLISWTFDAALRARRLGRIVLSTDDPEIAALGREAGVEVPFLRPAGLAADDTPMLPVVRHVLETLGDPADAICLLQPTAPLRRAEHIDGALALLASDPSADSVVSVTPVPGHYHPLGCYGIESGALRPYLEPPERILRRQDLPPVFARNGGVYAVRTPVVLEGNSLYGERILAFPMEEEDSVNVDSPLDLLLADALLRRRTAS